MTPPESHPSASVPQALFAAPDVSRRPMPEWLGPALTAARHQDEINRWPKWAQWLHRKIRSRGCAACQHWKKMQSANAPKLSERE